MKTILKHGKINVPEDDQQKWQKIEAFLSEVDLLTTYLNALDRITKFKVIHLFAIHNHELTRFLEKKSNQLVVDCKFEFENGEMYGGTVIAINNNAIEITTHT